MTMHFVTSTDSKPTKRHHTSPELIKYLVEIILEVKTTFTGEKWNSLSQVRAREYPKSATYSRMFGSFDKAIDLAVEEIKSKQPKAYFRDLRGSK